MVPSTARAVDVDAPVDAGRPPVAWKTAPQFPTSAHSHHRLRFNHYRTRQPDRRIRRHRVRFPLFQMASDTLRSPGPRCDGRRRRRRARHRTHDERERRDARSRTPVDHASGVEHAVASGRACRGGTGVSHTAVDGARAAHRLHRPTHPRHVFDKASRIARRLEHRDGRRRTPIIVAALRRAFTFSGIRVQLQADACTTNTQALQVTPEMKKRVTTLVADLPRVWHDSRTPARERKRMLRAPHRGCDVGPR